MNLDGKDDLKWQIAVSVFAFFWVVELLTALFDYVIIVGVASWYFTSTHSKPGRFSVMRGLWWSIRYNLGSLALGSFLLAVIWTLRVIFEYIESKVKTLGENNQMMNCVRNGIRCCLDCCHRFIKFLNHNAYIQVCLTGNNFCSSAMAAFILALKNSGSFMITNGIGGLISFLGKMTIACSNTVIGYIICTQIDSMKEMIQVPFAPAVLIFLLSYLMASIFMQVYSITSLTILQCLYADVDLCIQDGTDQFSSQQRPREMIGIVARLRKDAN